MPRPSMPPRPRRALPLRHRALFAMLMTGAGLTAGLAATEIALRLRDDGGALRPLAPHYDPDVLHVRRIAVPGGGVTIGYEPGQRTAHCYDATVGPSGPTRWDRVGTAPDGTPVGCVDYVVGPSGFRDGGAAPSPSRERVLVVGDSFVFGEGVPTRQRLTEQLAERLESDEPGRAAVLNRGVQGLNLEGALGLYRAMLRAERPAVVVLGLVLNDAQPFGATLDDAAFVRAAPWRMPAPPFWQRSRALDVLLGRLQATLVSRRTIGHVQRSFAGASGERFDLVLDALAKDVRQDGATLAVVLFPMTPALGLRGIEYPFRPIHQHVADRAQRLGIPLVDLLPFVSDWPLDRLWAHPTDPHPSPELHALAATKLRDLSVLRLPPQTS